MPFTFAHPAIVLPLAKFPSKYVSVTGLVAGSMAPDFEYFIRMKVEAHYGHKGPGILWLDLPLGILIALIFHLYVRNTLVQNLPAILQSRLNAYTTFDWNKHFLKHIPVVLISILLGIASHILWDGFTHKTGFFVESISTLQNTISLFGHEIPLYKLLQHGSTLLGFLAILLVILKLPKSEIPVKQIDINYWTVLIMIPAVITTTRFMWGNDMSAIGNVVVTAISGFLLALILTPVIVGSRS